MKRVIAGMLVVGLLATVMALPVPAVAMATGMAPGPSSAAWRWGR